MIQTTSDSSGLGESEFASTTTDGCHEVDPISFHAQSFNLFAVSGRSTVSPILASRGFALTPYLAKSMEYKVGSIRYKTCTLIVGAVMTPAAIQLCCILHPIPDLFDLCFFNLLKFSSERPTPRFLFHNPFSHCDVHDLANYHCSIRVYTPL